MTNKYAMIKMIDVSDGLVQERHNSGTIASAYQKLPFGMPEIHVYLS